MSEYEYSHIKNASANNPANIANIIVKLLVVVVVSLTAGAVGFFLSSKASSLNTNVSFFGDTQGKQQNVKDINFNKYWSLVNTIDQKYPGTIDKEKLFESSLKGLVNGLGDNATQYFTVEEYQKYIQAVSGETFSGIGIEFNTDGGVIRIINVFDGSPAKKSGVLAGDIIDKVDGESVQGKSNEQLVVKIKGPKDSKVKLSLVRTDKPLEIEITRGDITVPAITFRQIDDQTAYIDLSRFTAATLKDWTDQWDANVKKVLEGNYKNLVIDLRSNGGGYVAAAVYSASDFVDAGKLIVGEKSKDPVQDEKQKSLSLNGKQRLSKYKTAILVDKYSASASEIFAGALQHYGKAKIIGETTFGKGTVQQIFENELKDGSALKITIANWVLPNGRIISKETPINPDEKIEQDLEAIKQGKDNVLDRAVELLKK